MLEIKQSSTFIKWRSQLKDERARAAVAARITRLSFGNSGDAHPVGDGISELRIHYGPGYRIYYQVRHEILLLLLCGGNKNTQSKDIEAAKRIAREWSEKNG